MDRRADNDRVTPGAGLAAEGRFEFIDAVDGPGIVLEDLGHVRTAESRSSCQVVEPLGNETFEVENRRAWTTPHIAFPVFRPALVEREARPGVVGLREEVADLT